MAAATMIDKVLCLLFCFLYLALPAQPDSSLALRFDFNEHAFKEVNDKIRIRPVGVTLTYDRFGNKESAMYVHGNASSYLNLGNSDSVKPKHATIAMWVNVQLYVLSGTGYAGNMFMAIRNSPVDNFNIAYGLGYNNLSKRFGSQASRDS